MAEKAIFTGKEVSFLKELHKQGVVYMIVGAAAAALQGPRSSPRTSTSGSGTWPIRASGRPLQRSEGSSFHRSACIPRHSREAPSSFSTLF